PTAVGFMICGLGVLFARPRRRPLRFFLGKGGGSKIAREAVPSAFALPILFELFDATTRWLEIDSRLAQWIFYIAVLCLLLPPILRPVVALNRSERLRDAAERTRVQHEVASGA
ncbi:MAG: hypothetical protein M3Q43_01635, partial [Actinomycetota bacterium]|nr:hypothetical protein [Actinomycetota bacterium]